jgi:hypothetical protein
MKNLDDCGEKGRFAYIVYCMLEGEDRKWMVQKTASQNVLNNGHAWSCKDKEHGLTGFIGLKIWANSIEDARNKMEIVRQNYLKAEEKPTIWE